MASELLQFYANQDDLAGNTSFWANAAVSRHVRKIHSGLPALIVDVLSDITAGDLLLIKFEDKQDQKVWERIESQNAFLQLLKNAVRKALYMGDGAFKISFDPALSLYPIIEFFAADRVNFEYNRGKIENIVFLQKIERDIKGKQLHFNLEEVYSQNGINYRFFDDKGQRKEDAIVEGLKNITHNMGINMAVPLIFDENPRHYGRGKSIFDGKLSLFDALDEAMSTWVDALRDSRVQKYVPVGLIPRNPRTGELLRQNAFDSRFIQTEMDLSEGADNSVKIIQPDINTEALHKSSLCFMEMALQGIIAPATLGIDLKRRDNATAQREKEKATLYTRAKLIGSLRSQVGQLCRAAVMSCNYYYGNSRAASACSVEFGEYASPSFDSQIAAIGSGVKQGIISIENAVEQLYGTSWSSNSKEEEVKRLKEQLYGKRI